MSRVPTTRSAALAARGIALLCLALGAWLLTAAPARATCLGFASLVSSDPGSDGIINDRSPTFSGVIRRSPCTDESPFYQGTIHLQRRPEPPPFRTPPPFVTVTTGSSNSAGSFQITDTTSPADGSYEYRVFNVGDNEPAFFFANDITIDTTLADPAAPNLRASSDTGDSAADEVTNDVSPTFTGTTEDEATVQLRRDGVSVGQPVVASNAGAWALTDPGPASGSPSYTVRVTDKANNVKTSPGLTVTVDTTAPVAATPDLATASDSGVSVVDDLTNAAIPAFTGIAAAPDAARPVQLLRDGTVAATTEPAGGAWVVSDPGPLGEGAHAYASRVVDVAGNVGTSPALTVTVDRTATTPTIGLQAGSDTGSSASDGVTSRNAALAFAGSSEPGGLVTLTRGGAPVAGPPAAGGAWQLTDPGPVPDGPVLYGAIGTDAAGNAASSAALALVVDTVPPAAPVIAGIAEGERVDDPPAVGISGEAGTTIVWSLTGPTARAGTGPTPDLAGIAPGAYNLSAVASDLAGNASPPAARAFTIAADCRPVVLALSAATKLPGHPITLRGNGFGAVQGRSFVRMRGVLAPVVSWSDDEILALVPELRRGPAAVSVVRNGRSCDAVELGVRPLPPLPPVAVPIILPLPNGRSVFFDAGLSTDPDGALASPGVRGATEQGLAEGIRRVLWRFGDGRTSTAERGVHTFRSPTTVRVSLRATDRGGLSSTATRRVVLGARAPRRPLEIPIPSQIVFDVGSSQLRRASESYLRRVAKVVRRARRVRVTGYTDDLGPSAFNLALSRRRADAVRDFLVTQGRVRASLIGTVGVGEAKPLVPNTSEIGRQRNRRVVLTVVLPAGISRI